MTENPYDLREEYREKAREKLRKGENPYALLEDFGEKYGLDIEELFPEIDRKDLGDSSNLDTYDQCLDQLSDIAAEEFYND